MPTFVDLQFFKHDKDYILKELAILGPGIEHFIVKPPFEFSSLSCEDSRQAVWLEKNYHGIAWEDGFISYEEVPALIKSRLRNKDEIYVKGLEKKVWLEKFGIPSQNLEDFGFNVRLKDLHDGWHCFLHYGVCALRNVFHFRKWYNKEMMYVILGNQK